MLIIIYLTQGLQLSHKYETWHTHHQLKSRLVYETEDVHLN